MLNLQPYQDPTYFVILGLGLIPIILGLFFQKRISWYEDLFSLVFLFLAFDGRHFSQGLALCLLYFI